MRDDHIHGRFSFAAYFRFLDSPLDFVSWEMTVGTAVAVGGSSADFLNSSFLLSFKISPGD